MWGEKRLEILAALEEIPTGIGDFFEIFLSAGRGLSMSGVSYHRERQSRTRASERAERERLRELRKRYSDFLYRLKQDGLVQEVTRRGIRKCILTLKGKLRLETLRKRRKTALPETNAYPSTAADEATIVAFDVPEKERRKRDWLRAVLKNLGLTMVQRSVFAGKCKIPRRLLDDLVKLRLVERVEIFTVTKTGSLKHIL